MNNKTNMNVQATPTTLLTAAACTLRRTDNHYVQRCSHCPLQPTNRVVPPLPSLDNPCPYINIHTYCCPPSAPTDPSTKYNLSRCHQSNATVFFCWLAAWPTSKLSPPPTLCRIYTQRQQCTHNNKTNNNRHEPQVQLVRHNGNNNKHEYNSLSQLRKEH